MYDNETGCITMRKLNFVYTYEQQIEGKVFSKMKRKVIEWTVE